MYRPLPFAFAAAVSLAGLFQAPANASTQDSYPNKPVRLVVPYPAGGSTDLLARVLGQKVSEQIGQPVVVENRPGASAAIGASYVAKSPADGYTLLLGTSTALSANPSLYRSLPYDAQKDFAPIILAANLPCIVVVNPSLPVKTMQGLTSYLKAHPGTNYSSAGNGTPGHLGAELYKRMAGVSMNGVPYKGGSPALIDLMGGQTSVMFAMLPEGMPLVREGRLRALAVTTATRSPQLPQLPTVAESGVPGYEMVGWYAFLAPRGTPTPIVLKLNKAFNAALNDKEARRKLTEAGFDLQGGSPETLGNTIDSEIKKWRQVIKDAKISLD